MRRFNSIIIATRLKKLLTPMDFAGSNPVRRSTKKRKTVK